jgi:cation diffusion facilitator CzcD-associated flavoprotein CzcO
LELDPHWKHWFARGPELKRYADQVADSYDLRRHLRFGVSADGARWDKDEQRWAGSTGSTTAASSTSTPEAVPRATR